MLIIIIKTTHIIISMKFYKKKRQLKLGFHILELTWPPCGERIWRPLRSWRVEQPNGAISAHSPDLPASLALKGSRAKGSQSCCRHRNRLDRRGKGAFLWRSETRYSFSSCRTCQSSFRPLLSVMTPTSARLCLSLFIHCK